MENTSFSDDFHCEHGLSLYIETKDKKILFDVGASHLFLENAKKLNVNIADVDYLIISHGHYDHGGGLSAFLEVNKKAEIFIHHKAFGKYFSIRGTDDIQYIGLNSNLKDNKQIIYTSDRFFITKEIETYSNIKITSPLPLANYGLLMEEDGQKKEDSFLHEQNLIIEENGKTILITGCSHNGIINIINYFKFLKGRFPDYVIGGFHLHRRFLNIEESSHEIARVGDFLAQVNAKYFTCHCTGIIPFEKLKAILKDRIEYLSAGRQIKI